MLVQAITEAFRCIRGFTSLCHHCDHVSRADCVVKRCVLLILLLSAAVSHSSEEGCRFSAADQKWIHSLYSIEREMTKDIFCIKVRHLVIISLIISDNVAPQHEQMHSWGISCFCQPWNMTEVSSLHLHSAQVAVLLSASFTCLVERVSYFFSHWRSAVAQAASTSVTSTQCTTNSESNTMLWHVQLCYPAPTGENKLQKNNMFLEGLHILRVGLNLHLNIVLSVKCSGLQRWQTECFVCSLLHMRKSSIMDARWRKTKS